jgi:hypothetical protein
MSAGLVGLFLTFNACGFGSSTFSLSNANVDASYTCPDNANNARYDVKATIDAHNGTSRSVTIQSVGAVMTLTAVSGVWLQKVGDTYDAGSVTFTPTSVGSGASAKLKATVPSACTHGQGATGANYGEYSIAFTVATSAGTFKITSKNRHRILA